MGKLKRRLIAVLGVIVLFAMSLLPSLFRGGAPPPAGRSPEGPPRGGTVRTADGGPAPAGTRVLARGESALAEAMVDSDGSFSFDRMPEGATRFEAICGPLRVTVDGRPPVRMRLPGTVAVSGRVVTAESGDPVPGARILVAGREAGTDERGRFKLSVPVPDGVPPAIRVTASGFREIVLQPAPEDSWDDLFLRLDRD